MYILVTKSDGSKQAFDKGKVIDTCLRMGATHEVAVGVANRVEQRIYDGIESKRILSMIFRQLGRYHPAVKHHTDLRRALAMMEPKPDFEEYIRMLLKEQGYQVTSNEIVRGKCVEHEIDSIASKDGKTYIVEVKHHSNHHTLSGLDVDRISRAIFEDITEGFKLGLNSINVEKAIIVCNVKLSEHAKRYADCRGIEHIGWRYPPDHGIDRMIEEKKLYPITYLKNLDSADMRRLTSGGVLLLKQLVESSPESLGQRTRIPRRRLEAIQQRARTILSDKY
jgi:Holliday junction resolvase-like predicted endonuclease